MLSEQLGQRDHVVRQPATAPAAPDVMRGPLGRSLQPHVPGSIANTKPVLAANRPVKSDALVGVQVDCA